MCKTGIESGSVSKLWIDIKKGKQDPDPIHNTVDDYIVKVEESCTRLSRSTETERIQDSSALAPVSHLVSRNSTAVSVLWVRNNLIQLQFIPLNKVLNLHCRNEQCCGSGMFVPDPNFSIPDPGSNRTQIPIRKKEF